MVRAETGYRIMAAAAVVFTLLLAGCMGSSQEGTPASASPIDDSRQDPTLSSIEGAVVDQNFVPIDGAAVKLLGTRHETTAAWNGHFSLLNVQPGTYQIEASSIGWRTATDTIRVGAGQILQTTIFLDPLVSVEPYHDLKITSGKITCVSIIVAGYSPNDLTCGPTVRSLGFPADWAATVTEVTWGPSGLSSSTQAKVSLQKTSAGKTYTYARFVGTPPAKIALLPDTLYDQKGGDTKTPAQGVEAPLEIDLKKAPTEVLGQDISASATLEQSFTIYHTMFYGEAPADLEAYTAMPDS